MRSLYPPPTHISLPSRYVVPPPDGPDADEIKLGPRLGTSAAYDALSRRVVFFAGADPEKTYNDVVLLQLGKDLP